MGWFGSHELTPSAPRFDSQLGPRSVRAGLLSACVAALPPPFSAQAFYADTRRPPISPSVIESALVSSDGKRPEGGVGAPSITPALLVHRLRLSPISFSVVATDEPLVAVLHACFAVSHLIYRPPPPLAVASRREATARPSAPFRVGRRPTACAGTIWLSVCRRDIIAIEARVSGVGRARRLSRSIHSLCAAHQQYHT